jgi:polyisoprenoid-binding protein YceI
VGSWQLDPDETQVEFSARHLAMMTVRGHFTDVSATGEIDPQHPERSSVRAIIQTHSIHTNSEARDNDLRSAYFLDVENYPVITFESTSVRSVIEGRYTVTGNLTIKGNTRPVTLELTEYGEFNDPDGIGHRIAYGARGKIRRRDFGLSFNTMMAGRLVVSEDIHITIEGEIAERGNASEVAAEGIELQAVLHTSTLLRNRHLGFTSRAPLVRWNVRGSLSTALLARPRAGSLRSSADSSHGEELPAILS